MKIIATTTRPVLWPSPHRMPNDMAFHEFPTDKVASAERWSGPASTWNIPRMNPVLMSSLVIIPDKHWWPATTALKRNWWFDCGSWLLKPYLESCSGARYLSWLRVTTLVTLSSVTVLLRYARKVVRQPVPSSKHINNRSDIYSMEILTFIFLLVSQELPSQMIFVHGVVDVAIMHSWCPVEEYFGVHWTENFNLHLSSTKIVNETARDFNHEHKDRWKTTENMKIFKGLIWCMDIVLD